MKLLTRMVDGRIGSTASHIDEEDDQFAHDAALAHALVTRISVLQKSADSHFGFDAYLAKNLLDELEIYTDEKMREWGFEP